MQRRMVRILCEIIVLLIGCLLLFLFQNELIKNVAVGLITAGITAVIFEGILKDEVLDQLRTYMKPALRLAGLRNAMDQYYLELFKSARKQVDIVALTSENIIRVYGDLLKSKILTEQCDIRILSLDPESPIWQYRLQDESDYSHEQIRETIENSTKFLKGIASRIIDETNMKSDLKGSLVAKHHSNLPHFAYFRADDRIIIGLYYSFTVGLKSHAIVIEDQSSSLFRMLEKHFEVMWERSHNEIVSVTSRGIRIEGHKANSQQPTEPKSKSRGVSSLDQ